MTTAVLAPLKEEIAGLARRAAGLRRHRVAGLPWAVMGRLADESVLLAVTGDGELNARRGISALLDAAGLSRLIVVGVAGGLTPELPAGSLVAGHRVLREDGPPLAASTPLLEAASGAGARPGLVFTARDLILTPAAKASLLDSLSGEGPPPPAVVDLESAYFAAAAEAAGVPWLVLRAVSDTAAESLPAFLEHCRDEGGAVRRAAVVRHVLAHPGALPDLLRMADRVKLCTEALTGCVEAILTRRRD